MNKLVFINLFILIMQEILIICFIAFFQSNSNLIILIDPCLVRAYPKIPDHL